MITEGKERLERVLGTDEGKMTWRKDACKSRVIEKGTKVLCGAGCRRKAE